ncbi:uracil-DNA glycosylase-like protein [Paraphysoderma sedebokerense]|nr:uracil-DNA glycosylase-like protein [Paraphysoderma sedebokerense]
MTDPLLPAHRKRPLNNTSDQPRKKPNPSILSYFSANPAAATKDDSPSLNENENESENRPSASLTDSSIVPPSSESQPPATKKQPKIPNASEVLKLEMETMGNDWFNTFLVEMEKSYFIKIKSFLLKEWKTNTVYPPANDIYTFTRSCLLKDVKVVILGQDPYHGPGQAHGLCFSVKKGVAPPPSLVNIYKELKNDFPDFNIPSHGCLEGWAKQGVLLLNASLTVRARNANSHSNIGWQQFTDSIIAYLNKNHKGLVFMLWGAYAQKKGQQIDKKKHLVLQSVHPSPLSAHRGFFGCHHFSKANAYLKSQGKKEIDWTAL